MNIKKPVDANASSSTCFLYVAAMTFSVPEKQSILLLLGIDLHFRFEKIAIYIITKYNCTNSACKKELGLRWMSTNTCHFNCYTVKRYGCNTQTKNLFTVQHNVAKSLQKIRWLLSITLVKREYLLCATLIRYCLLPC